MSTDTFAIPLYPFQNLALSLSGGGFRAASFHLGTLAYLNEIQYAGKPLLLSVKVLSTISGGTFTGAKYALSLKSQASFETFFQEMYAFLNNTDLVNLALYQLADDKQWQDTPHRSRSLINAFAKVYYAQLTQDKFGILWQGEAIHLKEIIFNASDFDHGLYFRFQKTESIKKISQAKPSRLTYGLIGNYYVKIPRKVAQEIRMADIIAASSCFPAGFEPINFPNDFLYQESTQLEALAQKLAHNAIALMDGGVVDNQGIDSVILAEKRMHDYPHPLDNRPTQSNQIDLFIISDVSSPEVMEFKPSQAKGDSFLAHLRLKGVQTLGILAILLAVLGFITPFYYVLPTYQIVGISILATSLFFLGAVPFFFYQTLNNILIDKMQVPAYFVQKLFGYLFKIPLGVFAGMIKNRFNSVYLMTLYIFMRRIRQLSFERIYGASFWQYRRMSNLIYDLTKAKVKARLDDKNIPDVLKKPSDALVEVAEKAYAMGTTLWFSEQDKKAKMLDNLIAAGQFTTCFNLIKYVDELRQTKDFKKYTPETQDSLNQLYSQLLQDWIEFNENPFFRIGKEV